MKQEATWRCHTHKPVGKPKATTPIGLRDRFLAETATASQGYTMKMTYAAKLLKMARASEQYEEQPRGRVHPDEA